MKRIFPIARHNLSITNFKSAIPLPNSKQSFITPIRYFLSSQTNTTKSMVFGFSLLGLLGLGETEKDRELIYTIKKGLLYLQVSKRLTL